MDRTYHQALPFSQMSFQMGLKLQGRYHAHQVTAYRIQLHRLQMQQEASSLQHQTVRLQLFPG